MINKEYYSKSLKYHLEEKVIYDYEEYVICFIHSCGLVNLKSKDGFYKHGVHQHSLKKSGEKKIIKNRNKNDSKTKNTKQNRNK